MRFSRVKRHSKRLGFAREHSTGAALVMRRIPVPASIEVLDELPRENRRRKSLPNFPAPVAAPRAMNTPIPNWRIKRQKRNRAKMLAMSPPLHLIELRKVAVRGFLRCNENRSCKI